MPSLRAEFLIAFRYGRDPEYVDIWPLFPDLWLTNAVARLGWKLGRLWT